MLNNASTISYIEGIIKPLVNQMQSYDKFGVLKKKVNINTERFIDNEFLKHKFTLSIPYANKHFKCDVLFDLHSPHLGPDFIFEDESFLSDPTLEEITTNIPSLAEWNAKDQNALLNVIQEISNYYKQYQLEICKRHGERIHFEYTMLVPDTVRPEDVDIIIQDKNKLEALLYINLNMDYSSLPYRKNYNIKDMAILVITFHGPKFEDRTPQLELSDDLKITLQKCSDIELPKMEGYDCLLDYVATIKNELQKRIRNEQIDLLLQIIVDQWKNHSLLCTICTI